MTYKYRCVQHNSGMGPTYEIESQQIYVKYRQVVSDSDGVKILLPKSDYTFCELKVEKGWKPYTKAYVHYTYLANENGKLVIGKFRRELKGVEIFE